jgi:hypothetical protein
MIRMHQWVLPNTRTPNRDSIWCAATTVDGQHYEADSRNGAPNELARSPVAAGMPDQPVRITHEGLRGDYSSGWLHEMAQWTYSAVGRVRWAPGPDRFAFGQRIDEKGGETSSQVSDTTSDLSPLFWSKRRPFLTMQ